MRSPKIFFDASIIFAAIYSKTGGSAKLSELAKKGNITAITTQSVIDEVEANRDKFKKKGIDTGQFIKERNLHVRERVTQSEIDPYLQMVAEKDAHVIAGSINTDSDYLVTLDKKHLNRQKVKDKLPQITILSPKLLLNLLREKKVVD